MPSKSIPQREGRGTGTALVRLDLGGRDEADAGCQQDREDHRGRDGDDSHDAQGSPVDVHQAALFALGLLAFLGLGGASSRGSSGYVGGVAAASTRTSWLSVTLAWVILWRREKT